MNKGRSLALALAFQIFSLLCLSQPWFEVSMQVDGASVELGSFDGATTYPVLSPLALLSLAALSIVAISAARTRFAAILVAVLAAFASLIAVVPLIVAQDISALDSQLDRLTGIANTHGLKDVAVSTTAFAWIWIAIAAISVIYLIWMLKLSKTWSNQDKAARLSTDQKSKQGSKPKNEPKGSIELWDDQR